MNFKAWFIFRLWYDAEADTTLNELFLVCICFTLFILFAYLKYKVAFQTCCEQISYRHHFTLLSKEKDGPRRLGDKLCFLSNCFPLISLLDYSSWAYPIAISFSLVANFVQERVCSKYSGKKRCSCGLLVVDFTYILKKEFPFISKTKTEK